MISVGDSAEGYRLSAVAGPPINGYIFNAHSDQISIPMSIYWGETIYSHAKKKKKKKKKNPQQCSTVKPLV